MRNQTTPVITCMAANAARVEFSADTVKGAGELRRPIARPVVARTRQAPAPHRRSGRRTSVAISSGTTVFAATRKTPIDICADDHLGARQDCEGEDGEVGGESDADAGQTGAPGAAGAWGERGRAALGCLRGCGRHDGAPRLLMY